MRFIFMSFAILCLMAAFSKAGLTGEGYPSAVLNVRAGPGADYPLVTQFDTGRALEIKGCIKSLKWCEIESQGVHGWVFAKQLTGLYRNQRVRVTDFAPQMGLPLLSFNQSSYWDRYYRDQSFYRDRVDWSGGRSSSWQDDHCYRFPNLSGYDLCAHQGFMRNDQSSTFTNQGVRP